jgi:hypothetical protein
MTTFVHIINITFRTKGASAPLASGIANVPSRRKGWFFPFILEGLFDRGKSGFLFLSRGWALELDYYNTVKRMTIY